MLGSGLVTLLGQTALELRDARGQLFGVLPALGGAPKLLGAWQISSQPDAGSRDSEPWGVAVGRAPEDDPVAVTFERKQAGSRFLSSRPGVVQRFGDLWVATAPGEFVVATAVSSTRHEALPVLETTTADAAMRADSTFSRTPPRAWLGPPRGPPHIAAAARRSPSPPPEDPSSSSP
jgi:hypothetical protein